MNLEKTGNIELYYSTSVKGGADPVIIDKDEAGHIVRVMRHKTGDELYLTDGRGRIFKASILRISPDFVEVGIRESYEFHNVTENICFCIPKLKSIDRFETALEKCTELGITNFIIFDSERTIPKGNKTVRWEKITTAAMKQSLRCFLPVIRTVDSLQQISVLDGDMILFSQEADQTFERNLIVPGKRYNLIFGPEGDFTDEEKDLFNKKDFYNLGNHRLRSETAIIKCASLIS